MVSQAPKSCRMGDIYHRIKQTVDKMSAGKVQRFHRQNARELMKNKKARFDPSMAPDNMSDDSFESVQKDEQLHEYAEQLRKSYKKDPKKAICKSVIYKQQQSEFMMKQKMQPKEKVGNIVIPSSNIEQLIDMVKRHYKKTKNEKKGMREIREIQQIFKGTLKEFPQYIARQKKRQEREAMQQSQISKSKAQ